LSVEELDRVIDEIMSRAEKTREEILKDAQRKASEILNKPIPIEIYKLEAEEVVRKAEQEAERIIKEGEEKARELKALASLRLKDAVKFLVEVVTGLKKMIILSKPAKMKK